MTEDSNAPELPVVESSPCRHLRSKGMYVYTDGITGQDDRDYDNTIFWCLQTMRSFGPDDERVDRPDCRDSGRSCYEPT